MSLRWALRPGTFLPAKVSEEAEPQIASPIRYLVARRRSTADGKTEVRRPVVPPAEELFDGPRGRTREGDGTPVAPA